MVYINMHNKSVSNKFKKGKLIINKERNRKWTNVDTIAYTTCVSWIIKMVKKPHRAKMSGLQLYIKRISDHN